MIKQLHGFTLYRYARHWVICALACGTLQLNAQSFGDLPKEQQARATGSVQEVVSQTNWREGTIGPGASLSAQAKAEAQVLAKSSLKPFGADLFAGGFRGTRADGLNPNYKILPGDQINLRVWGAVEIDRVLPVDAQGNIFIPTIGPLAVMGVSHQQLQALVQATINKMYPGNVKVYTNLQGVQPVAIYVAGFVRQPGRYAGVPTDSILYFLDQAAGVDEQLGSYRKVRVMRQQKTLAVLDLYDFILTGQLNHAQLQDGDTILVEARGPAVSVAGDVGRPYLYELTDEKLTGETLTELAQLKAGVSHVLVRGQRNEGPVAQYLALDEFAATEIANGDEVLFFADQRDQRIVVQLEGSYIGASHFVLPKDATLHELLNNIAVDPGQSDFKSVSIRRLSVAEKQRQSLVDSLRRLETTYLGAPSSTAEESAIRVREAELISAFVARVREVKPNGRMVVSQQDEIVDIRLQDGDVVTIPQRSDAILISGEVYLPQSSVFVAGKSVYDYIRSAGGFSQHADRSNILVVRQNGEVLRAADVDLRPGDEVLVLPAVSTKNLQLATSITQILYQVAIAAKVAVDF